MAIAAHRSFLADVLRRQRDRRQRDRRQLIDPTFAFKPQPHITGHHARPNSDTPGAGPSKRNVVNYVEEEETVRNDLSGWYVQSGQYGSNHIFGAGDHEICEEYPALRRLMDLKAEHVEQYAHPPLLLPLASTSATNITTSIGNTTRFDVILLRPLETWQATADLPIRAISADPGFVFLWVGQGDSEGLERGRECFARWGFRRAEDIVLVKTNTNQQKSKGQGAGGEGLFASSAKEHCLMGIRGTVRRSTDHKFVHCNVDTDVIVHQGGQDDAEGKDKDGTPFPPYLYTLIENFCLGARRLELFGNPHTARRGWVTATTSIMPSAPELGPENTFDPTIYPSLLPRDDGRPIVPYHPEIDQLRPKSPVRRGQHQQQQQIARQGHGIANLPPRPSGPPPPPRHQNQHQQQRQGIGPPFIDPMAAQMQMQMQAQMQMQMQMQQMHMMAMMNNPMMMMGQGQGQYGYDGGAGAGGGQMYGGQMMYPGQTGGAGAGTGQYGQWQMDANAPSFQQQGGGQGGPGTGWGWQQQ